VKGVSENSNGESCRKANGEGERREEMSSMASSAIRKLQWRNEIKWRQLSAAWRNMAAQYLLRIAGGNGIISLNLTCLALVNNG
jgi:hypothetical protein